MEKMIMILTKFEVIWLFKNGSEERQYNVIVTSQWLFSTFLTFQKKKLTYVLCSYVFLARNLDYYYELHWESKKKPMLDRVQALIKV